MVNYLKNHKGKSTSSCPNPEDWIAAFGDARYIFGVTITSGMSGSYNTAQIAKQLYEEEHPERHVCIIDSLSAGPGEAILIEKLEELITAGKDFDSICSEITAYQKQTGLLFILQSLTNFANNGRIHPTIAKIVGVLGICIVGKASQEGTLEPLSKCRGMKKSFEAIVEQLRQSGFVNGKIRIAHCFNESGAIELKNTLLEVFTRADIRISKTHGLCSFYAEKGGILLAYEK